MFLWQPGENYPRIITKYSFLTISLRLYWKKNSADGWAIPVGDFQYGKCPKISNSLFHTTFGLNFAFYAVVSYNT